MHDCGGTAPVTDPATGIGRPAATHPRRVWLAPVLAAAVTVAAGVLRWRGVDLPAQLYRVDLFHRQGLTLWDSQWYSGHFTLNYSVLFPPVAGTIGVRVTEVLSAAAAAWAFDRLVIGRFGPTARVGSAAFALGTLVQVAIGQVPFLLGEALALVAFLAATRRRWALAAGLALASSLASPQAGAFLGLAVAAWLLSSWPRRRGRLALVIAAAALPVAVGTIVFPGQGPMPFPAADFVAEGLVFGVAALVVPRSQRAFRMAAGLYLAAFVASFVVPSPVGVNIERLGETLGVPLAICLLWPLRRAALAAIAVPIAFMQWGPALTSVTANRSNPSARRPYFAPLIDYIAGQPGPPGRVEIVPTALHWEAAYAAPSLPLARGWERQLDTADNPLFYTAGALTPASYRSWLIDNGVRFVAVPDVKLDYIAVPEAKLVRAGIAGLDLVWSNAHWKVYGVGGSAGLVSGPARLIRVQGGEIDLDVTAPGTIVVKERYSDKWAVVGGSGCVLPDGTGWLAVHARAPGPMRLDVRLFGPATAC